MTTPPSRLLLRLNAEIAAEKNPFRADLLRAERATYLARHGKLNEAKSDIAELHGRYDLRPNVEMSAWISLAEGLLGFSGDPSQPTLDKLRRSRALSEAAGLRQLQALSSAWLAQLDYLRLDLPSMSRNLKSALMLSDEGNDAAQARLTLVLAQGFHTADRFDIAIRWYEKSRMHALAHGDDTTVSALMHNMAWIRTTNMRNSTLCGSPDSGNGAHALAAAESTRNYDRLIGSASLDSYVPLLHAQILTLQGEFPNAAELYERYIPSSVAQGLGRLEGLFLADLAFCSAMSGRIESARSHAGRALQMLQSPGNCDDRAPGFSRLAQVYRLLGDPATEESCSDASSWLWREHKTMCSNLFEALESALSDAER